MNEHQGSTVGWWIGGFIVIALSGIGAYFYDSRTSVAPVSTTTTSTTTTTTPAPAPATSTTPATAASATELDSSVTDVSSGLTALDTSLSDFDKTDTTESAPSL